MKKFFVLMLAAGMILLLASCGRPNMEKMTIGEFVGQVLGGSRDASEKNEKLLGFSENEDGSSRQTALQETGCSGESGKAGRAGPVKSFIQMCCRQVSNAIQKQIATIQSLFLRHRFH